MWFQREADASSSAAEDETPLDIGKLLTIAISRQVDASSAQATAATYLLHPWIEPGKGLAGKLRPFPALLESSRLILRPLGLAAIVIPCDMAIGKT